MTNNPDDLESPDSPEPPDPEAALRAAMRMALAEADAPRAETVTDAHTMAGRTIGQLTGTVAVAVSAKLDEAAKSISGGDLTTIEGRLASQAATLDILFHHLTQFAIKAPRTAEEFGAYMKLALKAQHQSALAFAALAEIKQPPRVIFAAQLNAAKQQFIHNTAQGDTPRHSSRHRPRRSQEPALSLPEPSPLPDHAPLDTTGARKAAPAYSNLAPLDEIKRPPQ